ncbi:MAG: S46 family peptidase [Deltaproteobacteria bacterium]|nr:S46 family peptidase [Deltaproteobacteria bacterium]
MTAKTTGALLSTLLLVGCGPSHMDREPDHGTTIAVDGTASKPDPSLPARQAFKNPGGMWTPEQVADQATTLRELGVGIPPSAFRDPTAHPLGAVVFLGGCSASFVSPDGLIITNHHCATGALQYNSKAGANLMRDGYLAATRKDEKSNGPAARVYVTRSFLDVTDKVRAGIEQVADDLERHVLIQERNKQLVASCEKGKPELRCSVVSYYGGEQYVLIEQLEIRDLRLVYAPAEAIGSYGGEKDNWQWPRHSGDFAFFRAYVGPDLKPADYDEKNVPYRPTHHLAIATEPLKESDLVFVVGYPHRTTRLRTAQEVAEAVDWIYPRRLKLCQDYMALLDRLGKQDEQLAIKGRRLRKGLSNAAINAKGMLDGLVKGGLKDQKVTLEKQLVTWAASQSDHREAGEGIANLGKLYAKYRGQRDSDAATQEAVWMSILLSAADNIVHMAEQRPLADADRHPDFQSRNHKRLEQRQQTVQRSYARQLDREKLALALERAARLPKGKRPQLLRLVLGNQQPTAAAIAKALAPLYDQTKLEDVDERIRLFREASTAELTQSTDPFIQLALKLRPLLQQIEDRADGYKGGTALERPKYIAALRAQQGGVLAPDANATLRITYGTVRGYRPRPGAPPHAPFTKLSGMVKKHTGKPPFNAPEGLVKAAKAGPFEPYVHADIGEVPVDFLTDLDITGGNSGSPTLNARGKLVGLAFDGNFESIAADWVFMPEVTRSIHVDIRYALWIMDRVDGADHLLKELGVEPQLP